MSRFGLIQLSDLQYGAKHRFETPSKIHESLANDILFLSEKYQFIPIYIIITGDITETGHADEFFDASNSIDNLCRSISIDKSSVLAVPGNHDINWPLSKVANEVGDLTLKYNNYNKFVIKTCNKSSLISTNGFAKHIDNRYGLEFLFMNSCELEDYENHIGFVDKDKLVSSLKKKSLEDTNAYTKICLTHHRIEHTDTHSKSVINNSYEIESILIVNGYHITLSGHIHESRCYECIQDNHKLIHSGAGSAGVNLFQRMDGTQNQYSIHILDSFNKRIETLWRAYSPSKRTKFGFGGWTEDNSVSSNPSLHELPHLVEFNSVTSNAIEDSALIEKYNIRSNPFNYSNAEKISVNNLIELFVSSEGRNKSAVRLTGDAIIRGSRGSGKTMLLRYLEIFGNIIFNDNIRQKRVSDSFPVMINLSNIHNSEWKKNPESLINSSEKLIFDSIIFAIEKKSKELHSPEFRNAIFKLKQKLSILNKSEGSIIWKLGIALNETMSSYFRYILLLIDEVAPVFPKEFFTDRENGFIRWMNSIRNSGPYFTRIAVYPNDLSDILNEERFGIVVNLDYDVKNYDDYLAFRTYCIELVNKYLKVVSINSFSPTKISDIIEVLENNPEDSLEQIIYASDGSSRRFISLMDKCITSPFYQRGEIFKKDQIINIIKDFSSNLLASYDVSDKELAQSIAKACKKQVAYRFRVPGLSSLITPLFAKNEELNIVKLTEVGKGKRGTSYEFTYPYCILMDIQTHYFKDTRKVCNSRDLVNGEWINQVTSIHKDQIDFLNNELRIEGVVTDVDEDLILITGLNKELYLSESFEQTFKVGDRVSFLNINEIASDISKIQK